MEKSNSLALNKLSSQALFWSQAFPRQFRIINFFSELLLTEEDRLIVHETERKTFQQIFQTLGCRHNLCLSPLTSAGGTFSWKHLNFGAEAETFSKIGHMYLFQTNHHNNNIFKSIHFCLSLTLTWYINTDLHRRCPFGNIIPLFFLLKFWIEKKKKYALFKW